MLDEDYWSMLRGVKSWLEVLFDTLSDVGDTTQSKHREVVLSNEACISRLREVQNNFPSLRDAIQRSIDKLKLDLWGMRLYWAKALLMRKSLILFKAEVDTFPVTDPAIKSSKFDIALERDPHFIVNLKYIFQNRVSHLCRRWLFYTDCFLQDVDEITRKHGCVCALGRVE